MSKNIQIKIKKKKKPLLTSYYDSIKSQSTITQDTKNLLSISQKKSTKRNDTKRQAISLSPYKLTNSEITQSKKGEKIKEKTLVIDLDETLIHSSFDKIENYDEKVSIESNNSDQIVDVYVLIRPYAKEFIQKLSEYYDIVLFTASSCEYADNLIDLIDTEKNIKNKCYRENCTIQEGLFIKDLSSLGIDLRNIVLIDNSIISFAYQQENGIPIKSWYNDYSDMELLKLIPILKNLSGFYDVRTEIPKFVINNTFIWIKGINWIKDNCLNVSYLQDLQYIIQIEKNNFYSAETISNDGDYCYCSRNNNNNNASNYSKNDTDFDIFDDDYLGIHLDENNISNNNKIKKNNNDKTIDDNNDKEINNSLNNNLDNILNYYNNNYSNYNTIINNYNNTDGNIKIKDTSYKSNKKFIKIPKNIYNDKINRSLNNENNNIKIIEGSETLESGNNSTLKKNNINNKKHQIIHSNNNNNNINNLLYTNNGNSVIQSYMNKKNMLYLSNFHNLKKKGKINWKYKMINNDNKNNNKNNKNNLNIEALNNTNVKLHNNNNKKNNDINSSENITFNYLNLTKNNANNISIDKEKIDALFRTQNHNDNNNNKSSTITNQMKKSSSFKKKKLLQFQNKSNDFKSIAENFIKLNKPISNKSKEKNKTYKELNYVNNNDSDLLNKILKIKNSSKTNNFNASMKKEKINISNNIINDKNINKAVKSNTNTNNGNHSSSLSINIANFHHILKNRINIINSNNKSNCNM